MNKIDHIAYGEHPNQILDLYLPCEKDFSVFIYFHGGGLESGTRELGIGFTEYLLPRGVAVVSADYRMYPAAHYPDFIEDAAAVVGWVKRHIHEYGNCEKIFVGGSSAGGYLSMMLCFDWKYLEKEGICPADLAGFVHDAGQPTSHFNVLREKGIDTRRVIVDETAPLYYIGLHDRYAPMLFIVSDHDMEKRYEQTILTVSTLRHFQPDNQNVFLEYLHGNHCQHDFAYDEQGNSIFGKLIYSLINGTAKRAY